jgi:hypothetical protein
MLVTMNPGEPVTCSEHGPLATPTGAPGIAAWLLRAVGVQYEGDVPARLAAGAVALVHLRDVHGKDVDGALQKVLAQARKEAQQPSQSGG